MWEVGASGRDVYGRKRKEEGRRKSPSHQSKAVCFPRRKTKKKEEEKESEVSVPGFFFFEFPDPTFPSPRIERQEKETERGAPPLPCLFFQRPPFPLSILPLLPPFPHPLPLEEAAEDPTCMFEYTPLFPLPSPVSGEGRGADQKK